MPAWEKAKKPLLSTMANLKMMIEKQIPIVVIDVRPKGIASKGHIAGAASMEAKEIDSAKHRFPADKNAPIVPYADDTDAAMKVFSTVRGWGYKNTSVLDGGMHSWNAAGNIAVSGGLANTIVYVPKPLPGEIRVDEFKVIAETLPPDKYILDVRDEDEAMQGMLKGAHNIPSQDIPYRLADIPKDKEVIIHCITGVRAEMAHYALKENGYNCRFLNANIAIDADGKYIITKD